MKKIILVASIVTATVLTAIAQEQKSTAPNHGHHHDKSQRTPEDRAKHQTEKLTKDLSLTEAQIPKVQAAVLDKVTKINALRSQSQDQQGKGAQAKVIRENFEQQLKAILSPEQFQQFLKIREERKKNRHAQMKSGAPKAMGNDELYDEEEKH